MQFMHANQMEMKMTVAMARVNEWTWFSNSFLQGGIISKLKEYDAYIGELERLQCRV